MFAAMFCWTYVNGQEAVELAQRGWKKFISRLRKLRRRPRVNHHPYNEPLGI